MDNEFEGNADVADMQDKVGGHDSDGGDIDEELDFGGGGGQNKEEQELLQ